VSRVLDNVVAHASLKQAWATWLPVAIGLAAVYLPSYLALARSTWATEENGHGPIILAVFVWLVWQQRDALIAGPRLPSPLLGWASFIFGLLMFVLGRSQSIDTLEVASHIPLLLGILLLMRGWGAVRRLWFPFVFLLFLIPLPGLLVDALTGTLKQQVSVVVENLLYALGYPIARNGVVLSVGQYQLLVADACSGLNSMFSLSALGLLYLYLMPGRTRTHLAIMLAAVLPIAFAANVIRVVTLVLVTYYLGDEAGQGFAHNAAGMLLFVFALALLIGLDRALHRLYSRRRTGTVQGTMAKRTTN
jgi:exosortase B